MGQTIFKRSLNTYIFQEPDVVFGNLGGIPLSIPEELNETNFQLKYAPIVGYWTVVSPTKVSKSKRQQLQILGYNVMDLTTFTQNPKGHFSDQDIDTMLALALTGNVQPPPKARERGQGHMG